MSSSSSYVLLSVLALLSTTAFSHFHNHTCNHDHLDHQEPELNSAIQEDFPPSQDQGRRLASFPSLRTAAYYNLLDAAPSSYKSYMQNDLVPAVLSYFEGALRVKYPVNGKLTVSNSVTKLCGIKTPSVLHNGGVNADFYLIVDSELDTASSWVAESYTCQLASGSKRPLIAKTVLNRDLLKNPENDALLHEKNIYLLLHEITHTLGFSSSLYKYFLDSNGDTLKGHIKSKTLNGATATVVDVPVLTKRLQSYFGCSSLAGAYMENSGSSATAGSHFERRQFAFEAMSSGLIYQQAYSEFTLAMLEASGWYQPNYDYADPYWFGEGQGCNFLTKSCSSSGFNFEEFCKGSGNACTVTGRGGGSCGSDTRSDGCRFHRPNINKDCENPEAESFARLPDIQSFGRNANSKCFSGDLTTAKSASTTTFCFKYTCQGSGSGTTLKVQIGKQELTCREEGPLEVSGYKGSIDCPDPLTFCRTVGKKSCPRGCMGRGTCVDGECKCNSGYKGKDCAQV